MQKQVSGFLLLVLLFGGELFAQQGQWIETEGMASMAYLSQAQARQEALNRARAEAVRLVAGVLVQSEEISFKVESIGEARAFRDFFSSMNRTISFGQVVEEKVLWEGTVNFQVQEGRPPEVYYKVKLKARVQLEEGEPDPEFVIDAKLNKMVFAENEIMTLDIRSSRDCYVYIFNLMANDSLIMLYPNLYFQNNFLPANTNLHLMPPGYSFQVSLLPGYTRAHEFIYIVATKKQYPFAPSWRTSSGIFRTSSTKRFASLELPRWLANIPLDQRTDKVLSYEVIKRQTK